MIDPGFDTNDIGFLSRGDVLNGHLWTGYRWTTPGRFTQAADMGLAYFGSRDFDGNKTWEGVFLSGWARLKNEHRVSAWYAYNPDSINNNRTRGGPLMTNPHGAEWDASYQTDDRKVVSGRLGVHGTDYAEGSQRGRWLSFTLDFRPRPNILVSLVPEMMWYRSGAQYVTTVDDALATATFGRRYAFADMDQRQFVSGVRLNWTFTPRLSLELYAQPLLSSGDYTSFGELARPRSFDFLRYGAAGSTYDAATNLADPDGAGPAPAFEVPPSDFDFRSLRGNLVLRWEFRPGSTAYAVWTQNRSDAEEIGQFVVARSVNRLFEAQADNIFLIKIAYGWTR